MKVSRNLPSLVLSNGKEISPYEFSVIDDFFPEVVAKSLSNLCRYNGHFGWMSVAEHCLIVSRIMEERWKEYVPITTKQSLRNWKLAGLLHDSMESVFGDIVQPVKGHSAFEGLRYLENKYLFQLYKLHGIHAGKDAVIMNLNMADRFAMSVELDGLKVAGLPAWREYLSDYPPEKYLEHITALGVPSADAEWLWLEAYYKLLNERT